MRRESTRERIVSHDIRAKGKPRASHIRLESTIVDLGKDIKLERVQERKGR